MLDNIALNATVREMNLSYAVAKEILETYIKNLPTAPGDVNFELKKKECEKYKKWQDDVVNFLHKVNYTYSEYDHRYILELFPHGSPDGVVLEVQNSTIAKMWFDQMRQFIYRAEL